MLMNAAFRLAFDAEVNATAGRYWRAAVQGTVARLLAHALAMPARWRRMARTTSAWLARPIEGRP